jgi:hypothetical protein
MLARRRVETVRELEALQQRERADAGEPAITADDYVRLIREDLERQFMADQWDAGGIQAVIERAVPDSELVEKQVAARLEAWRVDDPSQWSQFEHPGTRFDIARACARIEAVFARHGWPLAELPVVGTLTTGQVSAVAQTTSSGAPLILIDNGFFRFSGIMSQLAIFAPYDVQFKGGFSEPTLQLISDLVATHTVLNTCLYAYLRQTPQEFQSLFATFQHAVVLFVIAHEYAHVSVGDLDAHPAKGGPVGASLRSKEFEADKRGFIAALEATLEMDPDGSGAFGPFLYLAGLDLLARAAAAYKGRREPYESGSPSEYPTPFERTMNLLTWLKTTSYVPRFADQIRSASNCYNVILFGWDIIFPVFSAVREQLAEFDPALHGPSRMPDADTFGVVRTLWLHVLTHLRQNRA